ncbi:MAG: hypothetical protein GXO40_05025 [Epsilonproteobacteria bacterium]|nr:hypothetical protein [Campylobacterota bacterium]
MKLWEFNKLQALPNYFLFYGDELFMDVWRDKVKEITANTNTLKLYYDEFDMDKAFSHLSQNSLFGDKNSLIVVSDKFDDKIKRLIEILKDNYFYFFFSGDAKKAKTKIFKNNFVRFFKPNLGELITIANQYATTHDINIDTNHLKYLISKIDYRFIFRELDKLALVDQINNATIDTLVFDYNQTSFDYMFDKLFTNQDFLNDLRNILITNEHIAVLLSLVRYIRILYMFHLHIKNIGYENVSKDVLGYQIPKNLEDVRKTIALKISEDKFLDLFEIALQAELDIKSSKDKEAVLFEAILKIKTALN